MIVNGHELIGKRIDYYELRGEERDLAGHVIGGDLVVYIPPIGRFLVNILTKEHFANDRLGRMLDDIDGLDAPVPVLPGSKLPQKQPFVLNDSEITPDVLERKFKGRIIEDDLANSLWFEGPLTAIDS